MRLYHMAPSRSTQVLWLLEEIGAPFEVTLITREEKVGDEHRRRHPLGRVPVIEDDGGFVFETGAICLHLADLHPEAALIGPLGSHERGLAYQWLFFVKTEIEPQIIVVRDGEPEQAATAKERLQKGLRVIEDALAGTDYLIGGKFGVADVLVGSILLFAQRVGMVEDMPNIDAYLARVSARPARERALAVGTT